MSTSNVSTKKENPFIYPSFWGRNSELNTIYRHLLSSHAYSCAVIGETTFGKTTLLHYLTHTQNILSVDAAIHNEHTFVYFNCVTYNTLAKRARVASQFWWDLYIATLAIIQPEAQPEVPEPKWNGEVEQEDELIDEAYEIKSELEKLVQGHRRHIVIAFDNFEGVANLPLYCSEWLRALAQHNCTYLVASRYRLYILYHPESSVYHQGSMINASPLWNLFSDPIYLGLMTKQEVEDFLTHATALAKNAGSVWTPQDINFVRRIAGRHPELLRIACKYLFEQRSLGHINERRMYEYLKFIISQEASPICEQLWRGLQDQELEIELRIVKEQREKTIQGFSLPQDVLLSIAKGQKHAELQVPFTLEQRGLIEWVGEQWQVFSESMRQFVLKQEPTVPVTSIDSEPKEAYHSTDFSDEERELRQSQNDPSLPIPDALPVITAQQSDPSHSTHGQERKSASPFTYLEGEVYTYLISHIGQVCSREELMQAIWQGNKNMPSNSALQKIIERVRDKLELDGERSVSLIAVRGQGYMLRRKIEDVVS